MVEDTDTIIALSTPVGKSALGVIRLSGKKAIDIVNCTFRGKDLKKVKSHTLHLGTLIDGKNTIDEVLVAVFVAPRSYTGENMIEISCHGSPYIIENIIKFFYRQGVRYAKAGEFTKRAFLNGKLDLAQAEAVADMVAADSEIMCQNAFEQMRGGFSKKLKLLRKKLIDFASLIALELDFSEEDVEFADRNALQKIIQEIQTIITPLIESFSLGNVIKHGIATVIIGKPNAGKSTLLNALLNEQKAIVSTIAGTTRDIIEDKLIIDGIIFRFIDTAGLRNAKDEIETIGIQKTFEQIKKASLIIYLFDISQETPQTIIKEINKFKRLQIPLLPVANKIDLVKKDTFIAFEHIENLVSISALEQTQIDRLKNKILSQIQYKIFRNTNTIVTNVRHYENLVQTQKTLHEICAGIAQHIGSDLLSIEIRNALDHLGEITGEITTENLLNNIFSKFCIGK